MPNKKFGKLKRPKINLKKLMQYNPKGKGRHKKSLSARSKLDMGMTFESRVNIHDECSECKVFQEPYSYAEPQYMFKGDHIKKIARRRRENLSQQMCDKYTKIFLR